MPIYDFQCGDCHKIFENLGKAHLESCHCPECGGIAKKIFSGTRFVPFKPYVEYDLGPKPVEITSKKQLEKELKSRGLMMDNRPQKLTHNKKREEVRKKAEKAKEFLNAY